MDRHKTDLSLHDFCTAVLMHLGELPHLLPLPSGGGGHETASDTFPQQNSMTHAMVETQAHQEHQNSNHTG